MRVRAQAAETHQPDSGCLSYRRGASVHSFVRPLFSPAHPCTVSNGSPLLQALIDPQSKFTAWYGSYYPHPRAACHSVWVERTRCFSVAVGWAEGRRALWIFLRGEAKWKNDVYDLFGKPRGKNNDILCPRWSIFFVMTHLSRIN